MMMPHDDDTTACVFLADQTEPRPSLSTLPSASAEAPEVHPGPSTQEEYMEEPSLTQALNKGTRGELTRKTHLCELDHAPPPPPPTTQPPHPPQQHGRKSGRKC
ncbi:hypothetical protein AB205_0040910 [Aquarana catesbeiana]|uniref:Uncharacterized protein n=1 Tax=Aquarana catesbeiana TaxID=8400 RepID=A0A2G9RB42_AQUCT|nr:hypothetical protein AB205_0040910 [Aquarana catesbeiana]